MARNIEIKARISKQKTVPLVEAMKDTGPEEILQTDVFFPSREGRFKLRKFSDGSGELILYKRPNEAGPKQSEYHRVRVQEAEATDFVLSSALGRIGIVNKKRLLYHVGRTRIHIDDVENLGSFLELEVVLENGESLESGKIEADRILTVLQIREEDLLASAYVDLLKEQKEHGSWTV